MDFVNVCSRCLSPRVKRVDGEFHCLRRRWFNWCLHDKSKCGFNRMTPVSTCDVVPLSPINMLFRFLSNPLREVTIGPSVLRSPGWDFRVKQR